MRSRAVNVTNEFCSCLCVLDATECPVTRSLDKELDKLLYSGKKKIRTLKYESKNNICYFNV